MRWHRDIRRYLREARRYRSEHGESAPGAGLLLRDFNNWRRSQRQSSSPLADGLPWVTYAMRAFLDGIIQPQMSVFEWGSGGSTVYFASRVERLITIEHDAGWLDVVRNALAAPGMDTAWQGLLIPPEHSGQQHDPADPGSYSSTDEPWNGYTFRGYASAIDAFADSAFDVIMVDGRARPSCAAHAIAKVKAGGYLILDNAERPHYRWIHQNMENLGWETRNLSGPGPYLRQFWGGTAWRKPVATF